MSLVKPFELFTYYKCLDLIEDVIGFQINHQYCHKSQKELSQSYLEFPYENVVDIKRLSENIS